MVENMRQELDEDLLVELPVSAIEIPEPVTRGDFCRLLFELTGPGADPMVPRYARSCRRFVPDEVVAIEYRRRSAD